MEHMEKMTGVFDGENLILRDGKMIPLSTIQRCRIEMLPYLEFPITVQDDVKGTIESEGRIIYPVTADNKHENNDLVYGSVRQTRIGHFFNKETKAVIRKPDLKNPHQVTTLGYRKITLEMKNGEEIKVEFDGNGVELPEEATVIINRDEKIPLKPLFDRPSHFINIIKKSGIEVYYFNTP
ncbi:hypothetical protein [Vagococcus intermedius]|uniref:Uncharacterized protein n=1 Tax=Vagococcus intermedius TaxID=2991418 RepID=A0AAF0CWF2_9ENTE|nr:hypothetical protein [Vagococcus intermedius]WEG74126.1 hypothetical protein OL234_04315 [Vagococcus intermedius]WEG76206.1 hypothetical protein OL235_04320 [Vagococcus intermedius]